MNRTTISLPPELHKRLRHLAAERGVSMATIIRDAIEQEITEKSPKPTIFAKGDSGITDTARTVATERVPPRSWR